MPRPPQAAPKQAAATTRDGLNRVWVMKGGKPQAVEVKTGATDGKMTEIVSGALKPGMQVVTETLEAAK